MEHSNSTLSSIPAALTGPFLCVWDSCDSFTSVTGPQQRLSCKPCHDPLGVWSAPFAWTSTCNTPWHHTAPRSSRPPSSSLESSNHLHMLRCLNSSYPHKTHFVYQLMSLFTFHSPFEVLGPSSSPPPNSSIPKSLFYPCLCLHSSSCEFLSRSPVFHTITFASFQLPNGCQKHLCDM